jgi:hypothetical protein
MPRAGNSRRSEENNESTEIEKNPTKIFEIVPKPEKLEEQKRVQTDDDKHLSENEISKSKGIAEEDLPIKKNNFSMPSEFPEETSSAPLHLFSMPSEFPEETSSAPLHLNSSTTSLVSKEKPNHPVTLRNDPLVSYEETLQLIPDSTRALIISSNFKERVEGFALLKTSVEKDELSASVVFSLLASGCLKQSNSLVLCKIYEALSSACICARAFSSTCLDLVFPQCLVHLADSKAQPAIHAFLLEMAECIGPDALQVLVLKNLANIKSPKSIQFALKFLEDLLKQFGAKEFAGRGLISESIDSVKKFLGASQAFVRQAAMDFFAELSLQTRNKFEARILDGLNASLEKTLKARLNEKSPGSEYQPARKHRMVSM